MVVDITARPVRAGRPRQLLGSVPTGGGGVCARQLRRITGWARFLLPGPSRASRRRRRDQRRAELDEELKRLVPNEKGSRKPVFEAGGICNGLFSRERRTKRCASEPSVPGKRIAG